MGRAGQDPQLERAIQEVMFPPRKRRRTPGIEVDLDPEQVRAGHDPQLERAIQELMFPPRKRRRAHRQPPLMNRGIAPASKWISIPNRFARVTAHSSNAPSRK